LERQATSPSRFKMDYRDGKSTGPPVSIKHEDRHSPELGETGLPEAERKH